MPDRLALDERHRARGAAMDEVGGVLVPRHYGDAAAEYAALRSGVGLIDRSPLGKAVVTGRDRLAFLQGMLTNDVKALAPGQGAAAAFLDAHGKTMALLRVYALEDRVWLELPAGLTEKTLAALDRYLISEKAYFEAADGAFVILAVQGPGARPLLERVTGRTLDLALCAHVPVPIASAEVRVVNRPEGSEPGFHCWMPPGAAPAVWDALTAAGAVPVGLDALDALRVESGVPWYGQDVDEGQILPETRLEELVSYTKGCYIGQEVVARVKYRGHVNRALSGLRIEGETVPPRGARITADGRDVGWITSAVRSPAAGSVVALGYVRRESFLPGQAVAVETAGGGALRGQVVELPIVTPARP
jgi:folate-binding protein YgfZ